MFFFQNINTFPGCIFILAAIVNLVQMSIYIIVFKMKSQFKIHSKDQIEETENNIECSTKLWKRIYAWNVIYNCTSMISVPFSNRHILNPICLLDILFRQMTMLIKVHVAFAFGLQTLLIDFSKIYQSKGLKPKNKGHTNFYEHCDLTKKNI